MFETTSKTQDQNIYNNSSYGFYIPNNTSRSDSISNQIMNCTYFVNLKPILEMSFQETKPDDIFTLTNRDFDLLLSEVSTPPKSNELLKELFSQFSKK